MRDSGARSQLVGFEVAGHLDESPAAPEGEQAASKVKVPYGRRRRSSCGRHHLVGCERDFDNANVGQRIRHQCTRDGEAAVLSKNEQRSKNMADDIQVTKGK